LMTRSFGFAFVLGVPFVFGYLIGRWVRLPAALRVVVAILALLAIVGGAATASLAGVVCGAVFFAIGFGPAIVGVFVGSFLYGRSKIESSALSVLLLALLIPLEQAAIPETPIESVSTSRTVGMSSGDAFSRILFYEDSPQPAPKILSIALPRPIKTFGVGRRVGDRVRCLYDTGYIDKEITAIKVGRLYSFKVIDQVRVEDHAVRLVDGSFEFRSTGEGTSEVTLTTRYVPKLSARFAWRPFERAVVRALHGHVLDSMLRRSSRAA
ncbi:MAG TPA: hypothetical protein VFA34_07020, partial [Actinomycetota bacterium]|nr:hypothetical protein [Actinomycetota bacterium]